jgi:hypothetical protein
MHIHIHVHIPRHAQVLPHRDSGAGSGQSVSLIVALGDYTGGEIVLDAPRVAAVPPVDMTDEGAVRRVRGVAYAARVPPAASGREDTRA